MVPEAEETPRFPHLVLGGMLLLFHFRQGQLQVVDVPFERQAFIFQGPLLCHQLRVDLFFLFQSLVQLLDFGFQLDLAFDEPLTALLRVDQVFCFLKEPDGCVLVRLSANCTREVLCPPEAHYLDLSQGMGHTRAHTHLCDHTRARTHTRTCMHTHAHSCNQHPCICTHARAHTYSCTHTHTCIHTCIDVPVHVHTRIFTGIQTHVHTNTHTHRCAQTHTHARTHVHRGTPAHTHVHAHVHTHSAHTHTHTHHLSIIHIPFFSRQGQPLNRNSAEIVSNKGVHTVHEASADLPKCAHSSFYHPLKNDSSTRSHHKLTGISNTTFYFQWERAVSPP